MNPDNEPALPAALSPLERTRILSQALAEAARRARVSRRSRRYIQGGFQARRGEAAMRLARIVSFWLLVAIPTAVAGFYYAFVAADQFQSEAQFTVQGGDTPVIDSIGSITGMPGLAVVQDTQIVTNYIESRAAFEKLDKTVGLRQMFSSGGADFWARLDPDKPIEKLVKYWQSMIDVSIRMPAGIVVFKVRAFAPGDAVVIARAMLKACEALVNELNDRMHRDAIAQAEQDLDRASERLGRARLALEKARNDEGLLDAGKAGDALGQLITDTRSAELKLEQEYEAQLKSVSASAPQMRVLRSRISATKAQIAELESQLTAAHGRDGGPRALSSSLTKFAELDLERQIAERLYTAAAASLEAARITAQDKMIYINTFVQPTEAQEARYPRRFLYTSLVFAVCLTVWGALVGLGTLVRNHMA
jgi:capsular polysaccharide transport system permease protein